jgi:hypothetical protein
MLCFVNKIRGSSLRFALSGRAVAGLLFYLGRSSEIRL